MAEEKDQAPRHWSKPESYKFGDQSDRFIHFLIDHHEIASVGDLFATGWILNYNYHHADRATCSSNAFMSQVASEWISTIARGYFNVFIMGGPCVAATLILGSGCEKQEERIKALEEDLKTLQRRLPEKDECIFKLQENVKTLEGLSSEKDKCISKLEENVDKLSIVPRETYPTTRSWTKVIHFFELSKASHVSINTRFNGKLFADTIEFIIENVDKKNLQLDLLGVMKKEVVSHTMKIGIDGFKIQVANYTHGSYSDEIVVERAKVLAGVSGISASSFALWCKSGVSSDMKCLNQEYICAKKDELKANISDEKKKNNI